MSDTSELVIDVRDISKTYRVYQGLGRGWLLSRVWPFGDPSRFYRDVEALKNVSFSLTRGEVFGIVGRNGSGKSTLLKLVAGLSLPTTGEVILSGQVRALLSLGINFHPLFSGRENIIFGSMAMGVPRNLANERVEAILDFAELHDFSEVPIQFYSSGMRSRLAAAVAFQETPEILIIDEALAAGDAYFVNKCMGRIEDMCRSGSTVLFVSHGVALVERLCDRAILLEEGEMLADGKPSEVVSAYRRLLVEYEAKKIGAQARKLELGDATDTVAGGDFAVQDIEKSSALGDGVTGTGDIELLEMTMSGEDGIPRKSFEHGEAIEVKLRLKTLESLPETRFYFELYSENLGVKLAEIGSNYQSVDTQEFATLFFEELDGEYELIMRIPSNPLGSGSYYWNLYFAPTAAHIKYDAPSQYYAQSYRAHPFISYSFPGQEWAKHRNAILEPAVNFDLKRTSKTTN